MKNVLILFFILILVSCTTNEYPNEPQNVDISFRIDKNKLKKVAKIAGADFGGGAGGVSTGAWWGAFLGPEGAIIGGMIGGVIGFTTGSISANNSMVVNPSSSTYTNNDVPFANISTDNPYENFGVIHNQLLNATIINNFSSTDDLYDFLIESSVSLLNQNNYDLSSFPIEEFKVFFKPKFLEIYNANGQYGTVFTNEIMFELLINDIESDNDFELFYNQKVSDNINDWQKLFSLAVLHHSYYFWMNKL